MSKDISTLLPNLYGDLIMGIITPKDVKKELEDEDIKKTINAYLHLDKINNLVPLTDTDLQNISLLVNIAEYTYANSGIQIFDNDSDYDGLHDLLAYYTGEDVISAPLSQNSRYTEHHTYLDLRGTLAKTYYLTEDEKRTNPSRSYLDEWIRSKEQEIFNKTGKHINLDEEDVYVFPKWDGVSGIGEILEAYEIDKWLTRGDTKLNLACNITDKINYDYSKPKYLNNTKYGIKTEIMMEEDELDKYNKKYGTDYKNTRSIVSSIINSDDNDERLDKLVIKELRLQTLDGRQVLSPKVFDDPYLKCKLKDREAIRNFANKHKFINGLRCDGAVIYIINEELQDILGRKDDKSNFEVAYKFTEESAITKVKDINWEIGLFGRFTPTVQVEKVKLKGNTIKSISIGSYERFKSLHLAKGDEVKVLYDIIPYLIVDDDCIRSGKKSIKAPVVCPLCESPINLETENAHISCTNPECECRIEGNILNYVRKMNIKNMSYSTISRFHKAGYLKSIPDLYKLYKKQYELKEIPGFGETSIDNILREIENHRDVKDYVLFGALGIESIGERMFKKILSRLSINDVIKYSEAEDVNKFIMPGIKVKTAAKICDGINEKIDIIKKLLKLMNIEKTEIGDDEPLFSVCFTNVRDEDLEKYIEELGGEVVDNVTKKTSVLIVPTLDKSSGDYKESGKIKDAIKKDVTMVPITDAKKYLETKFK